MRHARSLWVDELLGWPCSLYRENELLTPLDSPLTVLELDGGHRTPHNQDPFISGPLRLREYQE